jgi:glycerol-3-phosphate O-acyltransferase / dihydroxyacetone phosphate acyltransferase
LLKFASAYFYYQSESEQMATVLRLVNMIYRPKGTLARRLVHAFIAVALRLFFRRIEVDGVEKVPHDEPLIFVLNHPNGLIDPALVFVALPRRVSFLAKSTLFGLPILGFMLRSLETLPLYRQVDSEDKGDKVALNQRTFAACFELLRQNRCIALFPEGVSHNETKLLPIKTGAARIALGALSVNQSELKSLKIFLVGLYYTSKTRFRSEALLHFGEPFEVFPVALDAEGQPPREAVRELSEQIADNLRRVTLNVENTDALEVVTRTEQLFSSVYEGLNLRLSLSGELDLRQRFAVRFEEFETENPDRAAALKKRLADYEGRLRELNIAPEHLSVTQHSLWYVFTHFLLRVGIILTLSPLVIVGAILHLPAYLLSLLLAKIFRRHGPDESGGTIKILAAMFLMPLTWLIVTALFFFLWSWQAAIIAFPAAIICGYTALRCLEELIDLRGWFKAIWLLFRKRWLFIKLLFERRALHKEIAAVTNNNL